MNLTIGTPLDDSRLTEDLHVEDSYEASSLFNLEENPLDVPSLSLMAEYSRELLFDSSGTCFVAGMGRNMSYMEVEEVISYILNSGKACFQDNFGNIIGDAQTIINEFGGE